jgi:fructokinase
MAVAAPGVAVTVADTIGAGDTFGAAMLDELATRGLLGGGAEAIRAMTRDQVEGVLDFATRAAAVTVSRPGADPPYRHEL